MSVTSHGHYFETSRICEILSESQICALVSNLSHWMWAIINRNGLSRTGRSFVPDVRNSTHVFTVKRWLLFITLSILILFEPISFYIRFSLSFSQSVRLIFLTMDSGMHQVYIQLKKIQIKKNSEILFRSSE